MDMRENIIKHLEETISMAENEYKTLVDYDLDPDEFNNWMFGWMLATIKYTKSYLEQL